MPNKTLSRALLPDSLFGSSKHLSSSIWELAVAGWALAVWLWVAGWLIAALSVSFKYGISYLSTYPLFFFVGLPVTVLAVTAVARLRKHRANDLSLTLLGVALGLFALLGALGIVVGVIGIFVSLTLSGGDTIFTFLVQHVGIVVLGAALIVWALGELAVLSKAAPEGTGSVAVTAGNSRVVLTWLVPKPLQERAELASTWELSVLGLMLTVWLFAIGALSQSFLGDLGTANYVLVVGGPVGVALITAIARLRAPQTSDLGRFCIDGALLLALLLGPLLILLCVVDFFKILDQHGFGTVVGLLVGLAAALVMAVLTMAWALGELGALRGVLPGTLVVTEVAIPATVSGPTTTTPPGGAPLVTPPPPPPPPSPPSAQPTATNVLPTVPPPIVPPAEAPEA